MALPVTSLSAVLLGLLILVLTWAVVRKRRRDHIVLGDNDDRVMQKLVRGQANAAEQIPIALILMALAEAQGAPAAPLALFAGLLVAGRAAHGLYFARHGTHWRFRVWGMLATLIAQGGLIVLLALRFL